MFGFGSNKRIVLFDTLIEQSTEDEIIAVLAHEIGHWKMWHTFVQLGYSFLNIFIIFYLFSFVITRMDILEAFGYKEHYNIIALVVFLDIYKPISALTTLFHFFLTRTCEF